MRFASLLVFGFAGLGMLFVPPASGATARNFPLTVVAPGRARESAPLRPVRRGSAMAPTGCTSDSSDPYFLGVPGNIAGGSDSGVLAGGNNQACSNGSAIGAGFGNVIGKLAGGGNPPFYAFLGGGQVNGVSGDGAFLGAGDFGEATGDISFLGAGADNIAAGFQSFVGAGNYNRAVGDGSFIGAGDSDDDDPSCLGSDSCPDGNTVTGADSFIGAGDRNTVAASEAFIGSGSQNVLAGAAKWGTIGGGHANVVAGPFATIGGGNSNSAGGAFSVVAGGDTNSAGGSRAFVGGGAKNAAAGSEAFVGGGNDNRAKGNGSFIGAGDSEYALTCQNSCTAGNTADGVDAFIGDGDQNTVSANLAFVGGGSHNTVAGSAEWGTIGGGHDNAVTGEIATIPGGANNTAAGLLSLAAGYHADASHTGSFVWSDYVSGSTVVKDSAPDQFVVRASGGTYVYSSENLKAGVKLAAGSGTWASLSDRDAKTGVAPLDDAAILAKVATLPVSTWRYKTEAGVRHVGPMAQDFYAAFGVGEDDRHITSIDEDGVALAAIKALHRENLSLHAENATLRDRLVALEEKVEALAAR